jgi:nucleoside-diphosphate-sugar epimerase
VVVAPGFVHGPGGLFKSAFWDQARRGRLRCIGDGHSYGSCVHIDDLANGYCAARERAPADGEYNLVDDAPLRLREFVDLVTDAMQSKRVGTIPPAIMGLIIGKPLVQSLVTSCRVANTEARDHLAWIPAYRAVSDRLPRHGRATDRPRRRDRGPMMPYRRVSDIDISLLSPIADCRLYPVVLRTGVA